MFCLLAVFGFAVLLNADVVRFDVNESIPDFDETGFQNTQVFSGYTGVVETIEVSLRISGDPLAFGGDFFATLMCDNGGYAVLLNRVGVTIESPLGSNMNGFDVVFSLGSDDIHLAENYAPSYDAGGRMTGTWSADARDIDPDIVIDTDPRTADLDVFKGINPNGNWTLFVADMNLNGSAKLDSWGVNIATVPEPGSVSLLVCGVAGILVLRRQYKKL